MIRFYFFITILIISTNLHGAENHAREKSGASQQTPTNNTDKPKKITETTSPTIKKSIPDIGRPIDTHQPASGRKKENEGPDESWWFKFRTDPVSTFTFILAIVTGLLWWSTRQLVLDAKDTSAQQLRAYVFPNIDKDMDRGVGWHRSVPLIIQNFGKTPAHDFRTSLYIGVMKYPLEKPLQKSFPHASQLETSARTVLAPGGYVRQYAILPFDLNTTEIAAIISRQYAVFVSSEVDYVDAFKKRHTTRICLYSTGDDFSKGLLAVYDEGNDAN